MKRYLIAVGLACFMASHPVFAVENTAPERELKERVPPPEAGKEKFFIGVYDEYSWIKQGSRKGHWSLISTNLTYLGNDTFVPYLQVNAWDRFGLLDQTIDAGTYLKFKDHSYLRSEIGFGANIDYVYRFQTTLEYEHMLVKNYFGNFGFRYLNYADNDVFIYSPGLRYYFGDHYLSAFYNASSTEGRGIAQWGTLRGDFTVNRRLNLYLGTAIGDRLYDIFELDASKQYGYIIFSGFDFNVYKNLKLKLGYSYSMEKPSFIKRSIDFGGSIKF